MAVWARWSGYLTLIVLLAVWATLWRPQIWPSGWDVLAYEVSLIGTGLAGVLGVIAGWKDTKLWYVVAGLNFATCALMVAGLA